MRYRLYPTARQEAVLLEHCAHARFVWNLALEQRNLYRPGRPTPGWAEQSRQLTEARAAFDWLGDGSSEVQHKALRDLEQAFRNWWKNPRHFSRPTWRRKGAHEGFRVAAHPRHERLNRRWGVVVVPKLGAVKFRWTRDPGSPKSYRIKRDAAGRWWVAFAVKPEPIVAPGNGSIIGLDRGVAISLTTSEGEMYAIPRPDARARELRLRAERDLARCTRGSNRRQKVRRRRAIAFARETDARRDWIEKLSTNLARNYDVIRVEDLRIGNMVRMNRGLAREILASGWGKLVRRLEDKAPGRVEKVDPRYTSQRCSVCGHTARENRKSQAAFLCVSCGHTENADVNAAKNIAARHAVTARGDSGLPGSVKREPHEGDLVESAA